MDKYFGLVLIAAGLLLPEGNARCWNKNITDWFGKIHYDQYKSQSEVETCLWTIAPPEEPNSVLIVSLDSFPTWAGTNASANYLTLPEGFRINKDNARENLKKCRKYTKTGMPNLCSNNYLDHYCKGPTIASSEWPPVITSKASQSISSFYVLGFTVTYLYVTCPTHGLNQSIAALQARNSYEEDTILLIVVGAVAACLVVLLALMTVVLAVKLKKRKLSNAYKLAFPKNDDPYSYATDSPGIDDSANIYATVATLKNKTPEIPPRRPSVYLTMKVQESGNDNSYKKMRNDSTATDVVAADERSRRKSTGKQQIRESELL